jgi:hypothetical protein
MPCRTFYRVRFLSVFQGQKSPKFFFITQMLTLLTESICQVRKGVFSMVNGVDSRGGVDTL